MKPKILINGAGGRIGSNQFIAALLLGELESIVAMNDLIPIEKLSFILRRETPLRHQHLIKSFEIKKLSRGTFLEVNGHRIRYTRNKSLTQLPIRSTGTTVVLEATGRRKEKSQCKGYLDQNLRVVVSAPTKDEGVQKIVMGVNDEKYDPGYRVTSNASCTTNACSMSAQTMLSHFNVRGLSVVAPHAGTATQRTLAIADANGNLDTGALEDAGPQSTGAASMLGLVFDELSGGNVDGQALRIAMRNGSLAYNTFVVDAESLSVQEVHDAFLAESEGALQGRLHYGESDMTVRHILGSSASGTYFPDCTQVVDCGDETFMVTVGIGYDNEFGYSCRMIEHALMVGAAA